MKELLRLAKKGDKDAIAELILNNKLGLYKVGYAILKDDTDVADAISETIFKIYKNIDKLKSIEYFKTWITKILINECNYILKKRKKIVYLEDYKTEEKEVDDKSNIKLELNYALEKLDSQMRLLINMYYFNDMKIQEIAQTLKINEGTVKSRLFTARKELGKYLKDKNEEVL